MLDELFPTRKAAASLLAGPLHVHVEAAVELQSITNEAIAACQVHSDVLECRITGLLLLKTRRVADGILALVVDAIAQEAGALFRVLQELWELMLYLEADRSRFDELAAGRKPKAGDIARRIGAKHKDMRDHLNEHASHVSISLDSFGHLIDFSDGSFRVDSVPSEHTLGTNIRVLLAVLLMTTGTALKIVVEHDSDRFEPLVDRLQVLQESISSLGDSVEAW